MFDHVLILASDASDWAATGSNLVVAAVAMIVVVWGEEIRRHWHKPSFQVFVSNAPPFSEQFHPNGEGGTSGFEQSVWFVRIRIHNHGLSAAHNVEVRVQQIREETSRGSFVVRQEVIPLPLRWTYMVREKASVTVLPRLAVQLDSYADVFELSQPLSEYQSMTMDAEPRFDPIRATLCTVPSPIGGFLDLSPGNYLIDCKLTADEISPTTFSVEITVPASIPHNLEAFCATVPVAIKPWNPAKDTAR